ncbi:MAG TPA: transposase zinc-binding domain-containing protein, partial [Candidatus Methanoperedens sp.]|nr:transposase zinc-binding domain-containing protein [Candidatus Methanoperedens sp.]
GLPGTGARPLSLGATARAGCGVLSLRHSVVLPAVRATESSPPRRPREGAFYRLVDEHYERFEQVYSERYEDRYGFLRPVIRETVFKYLSCGDPKQGFARVRCRECGHEYLLASSCKRRHFCTSCHTKRAVAFAEWLHETVLWPVAHRQIVLTIPKMLRAYFRYDRRLLGELCRVAAEVLAASFRILPGKPEIPTAGSIWCVAKGGIPAFSVAVAVARGGSRRVLTSALGSTTILSKVRDHQNGRTRGLFV